MNYMENLISDQIDGGLEAQRQEWERKDMERVSDCLEERYFGSLFTTECERFGMMRGCREDCPVFQEGKCEQQEENEKLFNA